MTICYSYDSNHYTGYCRISFVVPLSQLGVVNISHYQSHQRVINIAMGGLKFFLLRHGGALALARFSCLFEIVVNANLDGRFVRVWYSNFLPRILLA